MKKINCEVIPMIDITEVLDKYREDISVRRGEDGNIFVALPFYHLESNNSVALKFSETENGRPVITDCGTTRDYLELMDINLKDYREKLNAIKKRFFLEEENGAFLMTVPTNSLPYVINHIGYFIQAISIIANIDL